MKKIRIDFTNYIDPNAESPIRQTFFRDSDLRFVYVVLYCHQPIALSELTIIINSLKKTNVIKGWVWQKINKIMPLGLIGSKTPSECKDSIPIDLEILKKHKVWLETRPNQFRANSIKQYHFLTELGIEWVEKVNEMQLRFKNGGI